VTPLPHSHQKAVSLDTLWLSSYIFQCDQRPSWNGFNEVTLHHESYQTSTIEILPFINLDPNRLETIYTALMFLLEQSKKYNFQTCACTFDQPLYQKAAAILSDQSTFPDANRIVLRLGGFHLLMSFMGALGNIMAGSGLEELLASVYAEGAVPLMMKGKAYSRALRAHSLIHAALTKLLLESSQSHIDINHISALHQNLLLHGVEANNATEDETLRQLAQAIDAHWETLAKDNRTIKLWSVYNCGIKLIKMFLRAERTGDWPLHIHTIEQMLPYFHAAGHLPYAKSTHLYLQQMKELKDKIPASDYNNFQGQK